MTSLSSSAWSLRPKMTEEKWNVYRRPISLVLNIVLILLALTMTIVLLWHRMTWGFAEWIHEVTFFNFWNGTYVVISASILLGLTCLAGYMAVVKRSICWLAMVCVLHGTTGLLLLVGSIAMVTDAFSTREIWLARMIIDMIDPSNYNNNAVKDQFLGNMYRIVECCGADGYKDYTDRFDISPLQQCADHRHSSGGIYYEEGCAHKFLVWLKTWAGCVFTLALIIISVEALLITWSKQLLQILKRKGAAGSSSHESQSLMKSGNEAQMTSSGGVIKAAKSLDNLQGPHLLPRRQSSSNGACFHNHDGGGGQNIITSSSQASAPLPPQTQQGQVWLSAIPIMFNPGQVVLQQQQPQQPQPVKEPRPQMTTTYTTMHNDDGETLKDKKIENESGTSTRSSSRGRAEAKGFLSNARKIMDSPSLSFGTNSLATTMPMQDHKGPRLPKQQQLLPQRQRRLPQPSSECKRNSEEEDDEEKSSLSDNARRHEVVQVHPRLYNQGGEDRKTIKTSSSIESSSHHETSWRITETPNMPPPSSQQSSKAKYHHYESIESKLPFPKSIGDPEIKELYRELRPGPGSRSRQEEDKKANQTSTISPNQFHHSSSLIHQTNLTSSNKDGDIRGRRRQQQKSEKSSWSGSSETSHQQHSSSTSTKSGEKAFVPQPVGSNIKVADQRSLKAGGYVNLNTVDESTLDRTRQWVVASRESLNHLTGGPALPPKPSVNINSASSNPGIAYGYENVLPISQKYRHDPYSMLSLYGTNTTCTTTSDDESEYSSSVLNDRRKLMKMAIARHTVIEENDQEYKQRLALVETSI